MHWLTRYHLGLKPKPDVIQPILVVEAVEEDLPPPANPTGFWCGSQEKIELMRQRIEAGESPFHPLDSEQYVMRHSDAWDKRVPWQ